VAVLALDSNTVVIDSSVFRQAGTGIYLVSRGSSISRSLVDTTTNPAWPAITLDKLTRFENTVIRGAAGVGLGVYGTHGISLLGGRIEGSGGVGLQVTTTGAGLLAARPIRVVGGSSYPAELSPSALARIYPAVTDQDSLLGNARDTVVVTGGILQQFAYPRQALPWRVTGEIIVQYFGILQAGPGASLAFTSGGAITARNGGRLVARGTHASPVLFTAADTAAGWSGIALEGAPSLSSYLTNVRIEYASVLTHYGVAAIDSHTLVIDSAVFRQNKNPLVLGSSGSRLSRSRVDTTRFAAAAVWLGSDAVIESTLIRGSYGVGLSVNSASVQVLSCEIRGSGGAGMELTAAVAVHNCNFVDNGGPGISNLSSATANVENDWWGDTAGPAGPSGDGASGPLDYTPWRTTPYVLPYVP
ncbi:MAG TPA: right-handed parallel beta-helix repeat-containing protein, partial [Longimicrobium sp.]|nr:right-handed parallel beta-helix repeat-containing protein [Longimicrobium sp.]